MGSLDGALEKATLTIMVIVVVQSTEPFTLTFYLLYLPG